MRFIEIFVWASAAIFWSAIAFRVCQYYCKRRGTNEKVRAEEKVVAVLKGANKRTIS